MTADENQMLPLHVATREGHTVTLEILLAYCNGNERMINSADEYGRTPLHHGVWKGWVSVVETLCEHSADVDAQDDYGATALHYAAFRGNYTLCERLLMVNAKPVLDNEEHLPLDVARQQGWQEVEALLSGGEWFAINIGAAKPTRTLKKEPGSFRHICCSSRRPAPGSREEPDDSICTLQ
jgi:ankyrin repeat protein